MEANRNLTAQVQDYQAKWRAAEAAEQAAEAKLAIADSRSKLAVPADEWSRMAKDGVFRLRTPCGNWDATARMEIHAPGTMRVTGGRPQLQAQRAEAAGFSPEELETLTQVYKRTHARLWQRIASACPAGLREVPRDAEVAPTDRDKLASCRAEVLGSRLPSTWAAMEHVAQEQAARTKGAGVTSPGRSSSPEVVVLSALASSPHDLEEEMVRSFGREKATRAVEWGLTCFDETILRAPSKTDGS